MTAPEVVTLGEALGLFLAEPGVPLQRARRFTRAVAGAELNVAVGLARLGHRCAFAGRVGDDPFGADVVATLRAEGVSDAGVVVDHDAPTGLLTRDRHGERRVRVVYHRAGSAGSGMAPQDLDPALLDGARLLHLSGITPALGPSCRATVEAALAAARDRHVAVSFDPNYRARLWDPDTALATLRPLASGCELVLGGEQELRWLTGRDALADVADWLHARGTRIVAVKRGAAGAWLSDGAQRVELPALPVRSPADPVGAGDAFDAGFLSGWLDALSLKRCGQQGVAAGAACVQVGGDLDGLPTRRELAILLDGITEVDR